MRNTIRVERAKIDITQQQLADAINVTRQTIYSIERNKFIPSTVLALKIAEYFKVTVESIFELEKIEKNSVRQVCLTELND